MPPTPSLQWLNTLKSKELQTLAAAVGTNSTGTKPALISALQTHLPIGLFPRPSTHPETTQNGNTNHEIISIDMGIRNLAYCRISLPPSWPPPRESISTSPSSTIPTITNWSRISISPKPPSTPSSSTTIPTTTKSDTPPPPPPTREPFDPETFSHHAYNLATYLLSPPAPKSPPTQILIERQRFRSMGGSAVQEWTLRVNMFEAMLYAALRTMAEEGRWTAGAAARGVCAVEPARVARFWVGREEREGGLGEGEGRGEEGGSSRKRGLSKSAKSKLAKIKVVEGWLEEVLLGQGEGRFRLEGNARALGEGFLRKRKGGRDVRVSQESIGQSRGEGEAEIEKLDDLADALLQGMAWLRWEENRRTVLEHGFSALPGLQ